MASRQAELPLALQAWELTLESEKSKMPMTADARPR